MLFGGGLKADTHWKDAHTRLKIDTKLKTLKWFLLSPFFPFSPFLTISLSLPVSFPPLIAGLGDNDHVLNSLSVGFYWRKVFFFSLRFTNGEQGEGEMAGWRDGRNGGGNSTWTTGALDAPCVDTHICTHTHRLGTQISEQFSGQMIGSLMCILSLLTGL